MGIVLVMVENTDALLQALGLTSSQEKFVTFPTLQLRTKSHPHPYDPTPVTSLNSF